MSVIISGIRANGPEINNISNLCTIIRKIKSKISVAAYPIIIRSILFIVILNYKLIRIFMCFTLIPLMIKINKVKESLF